MTSTEKQPSKFGKSGFKKISAVRGMNDILPPESARWEWLEDKIRCIMRCYGYRNIRTPILEHTELFVRGIGEVTDIVEKEMYSFSDRADKYGEKDHLTLRPENTAGVVRSVVENNLLYDGGKRLYYMEPMFRRERPQRGRYRQFHQIGAEVFGFAGAELDAELILLAHHIWRELGLTYVELQLNSLGQPEERQRHRAALVQYFESHKSNLDDDARRRLHSNPLRILDSKNPQMQSIVEGAPKLIDYLSQESLSHFECVKNILDVNGVSWTLNPRLVRGLDYYNLTVFEFVTTALGSQGTICGGGRYDYLVEQIGGKPAPAVGWAMGVERVLELLKEREHPMQTPVLQAYAIVSESSSLPKVISVITQLREAGIAIQMHSSADSKQGLGSFKSQFRRADASGAAYALIFGADELAQGQITVKSLRDNVSEQKMYALTDIQALVTRLESKF